MHCFISLLRHYWFKECLKGNTSFIFLTVRVRCGLSWFLLMRHVHLCFRLAVEPAFFVNKCFLAYGFGTKSCLFFMGSSLLTMWADISPRNVEWNFLLIKQWYIPAITLFKIETVILYYRESRCRIFSIV